MKQLIWPEDFAWSLSRSGRKSGWDCIQILEPSDGHTWDDNYFCSRTPIGMRWSYAGPIGGMKCTQILEPSDPDTWNDNYLCLPKESPLDIEWSYAGPVSGKQCVQWLETADPHTWQDNYLCATSGETKIRDKIYFT